MSPSLKNCSFVGIIFYIVFFSVISQGVELVGGIGGGGREGLTRCRRKDGGGGGGERSYLTL